jgi:hypothetical protein
MRNESYTEPKLTRGNKAQILKVWNKIEKNVNCSPEGK